MNEQDEATGDCFPVALHTVLRYPSRLNPVVVHGKVRGPSQDEHHDHAWVEVDDSDHPGDPVYRLAIDKANGFDVEWPASIYRDLGNAIECREYNVLTALHLGQMTGHYGPWEDNDE